MEEKQQNILTNKIIEIIKNNDAKFYSVNSLSRIIGEKSEVINQVLSNENYFRQSTFRDKNECITYTLAKEPKKMREHISDMLKVASTLYNPNN